MKRLLFTTAALCALASAASGQELTAPSTAEPPGSKVIWDYFSFQNHEPGLPDAPNAVTEVVVTANRAEVPRDRVPFSVTVLDAPRIRESQAVSAVDLLVQTPGVSVSRNGGPGQTTGLFLRGAESAQTLVVIDGVRVNDPSSPSGAFDFGNLILGDISRIEVLRGAQSTLWGGQAIGGVVNIVTAAPTERLAGDASIEGGSYGTVLGRAALGGKVGVLSWRLGGAYYDTDGVSAFDRKFGGREDDGFRQGQLTGRANLQLTRFADLDLRAYYTEGRTQFDGYPPPTYSLADGPEYSRTHQFTDYTGLNVAAFGGQLKNRLAVEYSSIDRSSPAVTAYDFASKFRGRTLRHEYQGTAEIAAGWRAVFGAERERTSFDDLSPFAFGNTRPHVAITSGYAQLQADVIPSLTLTAGGRYDDHETFGGHATGQLGAAWRLNEGATILRASYGSGFKAPTLYQLYSSYGNTGLQPETADSWDAGVEQRFAGGRYVVQATYFGRETRDQIDFFSCFGVTSALCATRPYGYYANIARTRAQGVELQGQAELLPRLILSGDYTYTDAENRSAGVNIGKRLPRRPEHTASATLSYSWTNGASAALALRYAGDSFENAANSIRLKSYTLVDLRGAYPLTRNLELYSRVENLADERYETAYQYGTLGRAAYAGVRVKF